MNHDFLLQKSEFKKQNKISCYNLSPITTLECHVLYEWSQTPTNSTGVAKVRPSKDFLRPLCQILDPSHSYLCKKKTKNDINYVILKEKQAQNFFCGPQYNIFMKFVPQTKKSGHPCYSTYS